MASSTLNIITFLLTTVFYYLILRPSLTLNMLTNPEEYAKYTQQMYLYSGIYLLLVILVQFFVNSSVIASACGGNITENMGAAGVLTFIPWSLLFGAIIAILIIYPSFKTAFSDVVGYFVVSSRANTVLTELLVNKDVSTASETLPAEQQNAVQKTADVIMKICGNASVLINQLTPSNFEMYWNLLRPLMKPQYQEHLNTQVQPLKQELFDITVQRDLVGEIMWYVYTGFIVASLVQLKIATRGCNNNPKTMEANYKKFLEEEERAKQERDNAQQTYTL